MAFPPTVLCAHPSRLGVERMAVLHQRSGYPGTHVNIHKHSHGTGFNSTPSGTQRNAEFVLEEVGLQVSTWELQMCVLIRINKAVWAKGIRKVPQWIMVIMTLLIHFKSPVSVGKT